MKTVGIIGFGSFGSFLARKLTALVEVRAFDPNVSVPKNISASLDEIARCDFVVLAIPVESYSEVCTLIKPLLGNTSVLVDIASVKVQPQKILKKLLPQTQVVYMHPLFGPQSAEVSLLGHTVVMCPDVSSNSHYESVKKFVASQGLGIVEMTPAQHDKEMALVQGLTFFVARSLMHSGVHDVTLHTPSFKRILDLVELESHHSEELFRTIQQSNPFTGDIRAHFIEVAKSLNDSLAE